MLELHVRPAPITSSNWLKASVRYRYPTSCRVHASYRRAHREQYWYAWCELKFGKEDVRSATWIPWPVSSPRYSIMLCNLIPHIRLCFTASRPSRSSSSSTYPVLLTSHSLPQIPGYKFGGCILIMSPPPPPLENGFATLPWKLLVSGSPSC
ncbi:hypothetical protein BDM02DRAFT_900090 [Thelephora ganbajun]|uniref:Uncharacterized protein n=1 Tax=Thelephora ganbajun TaxID=370292 RepID=A0ACB6ZN57_THEGA|nr:hypothetical protein BDM02DRAFT_900090 [Thelephora ganbajun]